LNHIYDLFDKELGYVQYTIQKFYRIDGGSTQNKGVVPDIAYPTAVDPLETGESVEDNALPWDSIDKAKYERLNNFKSVIANLDVKHQQRVAKDLEFGFIEQDIARYRAEKDDNLLSLNEKIRKDESAKADEERLVRINQRQKALGKSAFANLQEVPKDYEAPDAYLDESVNIMLDMITN
ncbi:MAG: carboxy terminal-processing peptidase, partial [Vibrio sp.]